MRGPTQGAPTREEGLALHRRLCAPDDPIASKDLARAFVPDLERHITAKFPTADRHLLLEIVHDAVLRLIRAPRAFDPNRSDDLAGYLRMDVEGDVLNALQAERRRQSRHARENPVELGSDARNIKERDSEVVLQIVRAEEQQAAASSVATVRFGLSEPEQRVLDLMLDGERQTAAFAAVLGLGDRPPAEQAREVKRVKDRIKKRLERAGGES